MKLFLPPFFASQSVESRESNDATKTNVRKTLNGVRLRHAIFLSCFFQITVFHFCSGLSSLWKLQLSGGGAKIAAAAHIWYQLTLNPAPGWKNARGAWDSQLIFRHNVCSAALEPQLLNFSCFSAFHQGSSIQCVWKKEFSTVSIFSSLFLESVEIFYCVFFEEIRKNISDFIFAMQ